MAVSVKDVFDLQPGLVDLVHDSGRVPARVNDHRIFTRLGIDQITTRLNCPHGHHLNLKHIKFTPFTIGVSCRMAIAQDAGRGIPAELYAGYSLRD